MKEGPLSYRPEDPGPCPYGHGPEYSEFKADGRRVCHPCRDQYQRRNRVKGYGTGTVHSGRKSGRDARKATNTHATEVR